MNTGNIDLFIREMLPAHGKLTVTRNPVGAAGWYWTAEIEEQEDGDEEWYPAEMLDGDIARARGYKTMDAAIAALDAHLVSVAR